MNASPSFKTLVLSFAIGLLGVTDSLRCPAAELASPELASQAHQLLKTYCHECHGQKRLGSDELDVLDRESLFRHGYLEASAEDSPLFTRVADLEMPREPRKPLNPHQIEVLRQWINSGAPEPVQQEREVVTQAQVVESIYRDLQSVRVTQQRFQRYFSIVNLHNNWTDHSHDDLAVYRAAMSKMLNSLSQERAICIPQVVPIVGNESAEVLYRIDIRKLRWTVDQWEAVIGEYPFGYTLEYIENDTLALNARQVRDMTETQLFVVRADWFVANASRGPIYDLLLEIPQNIRQLEQRLGVNVLRNYDEDNVRRGGLDKSPVSRGFRVVERHESLVGFGYYWKSFDFKSDDGDPSKNIKRNPLGPQYSDNQYSQYAFDHDGGEVIFSLPNGLQGYMLIDAEGNRIDRAPPDIVHDANQISGSSQVVNAVSCIHCHSKGIIGFTDVVRPLTNFGRDPRRKIREIYIDPVEMKMITDNDSENYQQAQAQVLRPFLDESRQATVEPVGELVKAYDREVTLFQIAGDLGLPWRQLNPVLLYDLQINLREPVTSFVKRPIWEGRSDFRSPYQSQLQQHELATPLIVLNNRKSGQRLPLKESVGMYVRSLIEFLSSRGQHDINLEIASFVLPPHIKGEISKHVQTTLAANNVRILNNSTMFVRLDIRQRRDELMIVADILDQFQEVLLQCVFNTAMQDSELLVYKTPPAATPKVEAKKSVQIVAKPVSAPKPAAEQKAPVKPQPSPVAKVRVPKRVASAQAVNPPVATPLPESTQPPRRPSSFSRPKSVSSQQSTTAGGPPAPRPQLDRGTLQFTRPKKK